MKVLNIIVITILVLIVIFLISKLFLTTDIIYDKMCDANEDFYETKNIISNSDFNENNTSNFMLSLWFYIDNWGNGIAQEKNILYMAPDKNSITVPQLKDNLIGMSSSVEETKIRDDADGRQRRRRRLGGANTGWYGESGLTFKQAKAQFMSKYKNLNIGLDKYENNLFIDIETYSETTQGDSKFTRYLVKNIPVQKWNCLTLSIDTKTFDVYLDGKLRNSFILHGIYRNVLESGKDKNIYIGNLDSNTDTLGFQGLITRIRYQPNAINPQEAYNIYREGINASQAKALYNKYGLKVSFMEYNKEKATINI